MTKYPCRCVKCRSRKTLNKHPELYVKTPTCECGGRYRVDSYRKRIEHKKVLCNCDGYWFPHRRSGGVWCREHPTGPTDEQFQERYLNHET